MSQQELLAAVVGALDEAGVAYMVTGSYASSLQGEPRATHDIDFLVDLPADRVDAIPAAFQPPDFYVSPSAVREWRTTCGPTGPPSKTYGRS
ncbi:MAG: hypothetical protein WD066_04815 [Planctomycetaceae bacterium]